MKLRNSVSNSLLFAIANGLFILAFTAPNLAAESVTVKGNAVNIRTHPSTDSPVYMEVLRGYPLKVLKRQGEWIKIIDVEKDSGWVYAPLVSKGNTIVVNAKKSVNMRSGPSRDNSIIASIERGVVLTLISSKGKWLNVRHNATGKQGWVYKPLTWP